LAQLAAEAARLGSENQEPALLEVAEKAAEEAVDQAAVLPGHTLFGAQAKAAIARVHAANSEQELAAVAAREALRLFEAAMIEDARLDILLPTAEALLSAGTPEEQEAVRSRLRVTLALIAQHILDEDVRSRWFRSRDGRALTRLAGRLDAASNPSEESAHGSLALSGLETSLLRLVTEGQTNKEIAEALGTTEESISRQLIETFAKIGASSRAEATATALMGKLV
jgi:DNA-binding NarL/FixJ family response regulator